MKKVWSVCSFEIMRILKRPQSYIIMFAMPLLFTMLFGSLLGSGGEAKVKLGIVDEEQSPYSKALIKQIKKNETFEFSLMEKSEAEKQVEEKSLTGFVLIEKGLMEQLEEGKDTPVVFRHGPEFTSSSIVSQILSNAVAQIMIAAKGSENWAEYTGENPENMFASLSKELAETKTPVKKVTVTKGAENAVMDSVSERAAGFSIMFVMIVMMSCTGTILEAKQNGVWSRLLTTPTSKAELMGGYLLSFFLIGWIQFGILMAASSILFDVKWGDPLGIAVLVSALLLAVVGLGLMISSLAKTVEQQSALGNILVTSTCMLGGVYWPLSIVPKFMQTIADFVPQTWAMKGFTEIVARGGGAGDILVPAGILIAFSIAFFSVGIRKVSVH